MILKTICPNCKAINESEMGEMETTFFKGDSFLRYPSIVACFHCKQFYVWTETLNRKWHGVPVGNWN